MYRTDDVGLLNTVTRHFVRRHHGRGLAGAVAVVLAWVAVGPPAATHADPPTISVVERVAPGDQLKVDGLGWTGEVEIRLGDAAGASTVAMPDDRGEIHAKLRVPLSIHYGDHTVTAICTCAARAAAHVTVAPTAYAAPHRAMPGSIVTIIGTGWVPEYGDVVISHAPDGSALTSGAPGSGGAARLSFTVPAAPPGPMPLVADQPGAKTVGPAVSVTFILTVVTATPPRTSPSPSTATHPTPPPSTATRPIPTASSSSYRPQQFLGWALALAATAALVSTVTRLPRVRRRPRTSDINVHLDDRANPAEVVVEQPSSRPLIRVAAEATAPTVAVTEEPR
jgi:hypothetical protein